MANVAMANTMSFSALRRTNISIFLSVRELFLSDLFTLLAVGKGHFCIQITQLFQSALRDRPRQTRDKKAKPNGIQVILLTEIHAQRRLDYQVLQ